MRTIATALEAESLSVWWDPGLLPGDQYDLEIERQIGAARCVIVVWSSASVDSKWVRSEASDGDDRKILLPVTIEPVRVPLAFRLLQTEDLSKWGGERDAEAWQRILLQVRALLGLPPAEKSFQSAVHPHPPVALRSSILPLAVLAALGGLVPIWAQKAASGSFAIALGLAALAFILFRLAEHDLSPHMKALAKRWLLPQDGQFKVDTAEAFNHLFEAVFGRRHFSAECFVKSTLVSAAFFTIITFISALVFLDHIDWRPSSLIVVFFFGFIVNALGDYVALLKTRLLLRSYKKGWSIVPLLVIDFASVLIIFAAATMLTIALVYLMGGQPFTDWSNYLRSVFASLREVSHQPLIDLFGLKYDVARYPVSDRILLYSSLITMFMTSLWLWIALLLAPVVRFIVWSRVTGLTLLGLIFDVHNAPFAAMAYLSAFIIMFLGGLTWGTREVLAMARWG